MPSKIPVPSTPAFLGKIGIARKNITPPIGIYARNWGAATADVAEGIHRPLTLSVLTFQDIEEASNPLVLIAMDLGWWRSTDEQEFFNRAAIEAAGGDASRVIITLSHTHSGPSILREDESKPGGEHIIPYLEAVKTKMVAAMEEARHSAQPALLETETGWCNLAKNRDLPDPEKPRWLVGWNPAANADSTLLIGRISKPDGTLLGTLVNYACHPTVLAWENRLLSPDFTGAMQELVERETNAPCIFMQGASAEFAPAHQYVGDPKAADRHGMHLGYSVLATLSAMAPPGQQLSYEGARESGAPLAMWKFQSRNAFPQKISASIVNVSLPIRKDLASEDEILRAIATCRDRPLLERLNRKLLIRKALGGGLTCPIPHRVWHLGEIVMVSLPNEPYSKLQQTLREAVPHKAVFVACLANGGKLCGYLPPEKLYDEDIYTVWQTPYAAGSLELIIRELVSALKN